jgi:hypothetical protein
MTRMKTGGSERRFKACDDLERSHCDDYIARTFGYLGVIADCRGFHIERHALLHTKTHQCSLIFRIGRKLVESKNRNSR